MSTVEQSAPDIGEPERAPATSRRSQGGGLPARLQPLIVLATLVLAVGCLYWGQAVLMPLALAIVLTFLLHPVVTFVERRVGRVLAVVGVVLLGFTVVAGVGWALAAQLASLGNELPKYKDNIKHKVEDLRWVRRGGSLEKVQKTVEQAVGEAEKDRETPGEGLAPRGAERPVPVVVQSDRSAQVWSAPVAIGPWLEPLATAGLVIVLVIFMLLERTGLRDRLLRLAGSSRLAVTTKALDEAGARISRYLLMQSLVNATFGLGVGLGLFVLGVPYALTWGLLAAALRFIPYVGPGLGALMPIALSLAVFPGWLRPLLVVGLFLVMELFSNLVMETLLYSSTAGVSQVALLAAVAFWTWLWGPIGLMLATPLTVCLVVLSKHVPDLEFVVVLMGDAPALEPPVNLYQRLLAGDQEEASDIVEQYLDSHAPDSVYDGLLLPALALAKRDRVRGRLGDDDERAVLRTTREVVDDVGLRAAERRAEREPDHGGALPVGGAERAVVLGCPARDQLDELALTMLAHAAEPARIRLDVMSSALLSSEIVARVSEPGDARRCEIVCIGGVPPGGTTRARYLIKRLRARGPGLRVVVGRWGTAEGLAEAREALLAAGADEVAGTLLETRDQLRRLCHLQLGAAPAAAG